jgi:hypothetical protein
VTLTQADDLAVEAICDHLNILPILVNFVSVKEIDCFMVAIRLIGNISSCEKIEYTEHLFKLNLLSSLIIGWKHFEAMPDVEREVAWVLSNIVASNNLEMTKEIIGNEYIITRTLDILNLGSTDRK